MELSITFEATSCVANILEDPNVYYRVHKIPALVPLL
jgi:hypothetical protein